MIEYITQNWDGILAVITGIVTVASAVAALTPTPKDDGIVKLLRKLIDAFALNVGNAKK